MGLAQGRGAGGHARRGHLQPAARRTGSQDRRLPEKVSAVDLGLRGRVAVVAAGSKGLGRAVALKSWQPKAPPSAICARGQTALDETLPAPSVRAAARAHGVAADVSVSGEPERGRRRRRTRLRSRRYRRHQLRRTTLGPVRDAQPEDWDCGHAARCSRAPSSFARAAVPGMRARRWGRIINITSIAAKQPVDNLMLSNSLRSAVIAFAETLANEVAADGITVNNLLPGYTRTERVVDLADQMAPSGGTTPAECHRALGSRDPDAPARRAAQNSPRWPRFSRPIAPATSPASRSPSTAAGFAERAVTPRPRQSDDPCPGLADHRGRRGHPGRQVQRRVLHRAMGHPRLDAQVRTAVARRAGARLCPAGAGSIASSGFLGIPGSRYRPGSRRRFRLDADYARARGTAVAHATAAGAVALTAIVGLGMCGSSCVT